MPEPGLTGFSEWEGRPGSGMGAITADETEGILYADPDAVARGNIPRWTHGMTFDQQREMKKEIDNKAKWEALSIQGKINKLERQKSKAILKGMHPFGSYSLSGNIMNLGRLYARKLTDEYQNKYGDEYFDKYLTKVIH